MRGQVLMSRKLCRRKIWELRNVAAYSHGRLRVAFEIIKMPGMVYKYTSCQHSKSSQHSITEAKKSEADRHFEDSSKNTPSTQKHYD